MFISSCADSFFSKEKNAENTLNITYNLTTKTQFLVFWVVPFGETNMESAEKANFISFSLSTYFTQNTQRVLRSFS